VLIKNAYADWTERKEEARVIQELGFEPKLVLRKRSGQDRSDMAMAIDAYDMKDREGVQVCVLGTGDADFGELCRRLKAARRRPVVVGVGKTTSHELIQVADTFISLESRIQGLKPLLPKSPVKDSAASFIITMHNLEEKLQTGQLGFIGLKMVRDQYITPEMCGDADFKSRERFLIRMIQRRHHHALLDSESPQPHLPDKPPAIELRPSAGKGNPGDMMKSKSADGLTRETAATQTTPYRPWNEPSGIWYDDCGRKLLYV
jgi:hypothetical protein